MLLCALYSVSPFILRVPLTRYLPERVDSLPRGHSLRVTRGLQTTMSSSPSSAPVVILITATPVKRSIPSSTTFCKYKTSLVLHLKKGGGAILFYSCRVPDRVRTGALDLELELQVFVSHLIWMLGSKFQSSSRILKDLDC